MLLYNQPSVAYNHEIGTKNRIEDWYGKAGVSLEQLRNQRPAIYKEIIKELDLDAFHQEIFDVHNRLQRLDSPVVFTHNDVAFNHYYCMFITTPCDYFDIL